MQHQPGYAARSRLSDEDLYAYYPETLSKIPSSGNRSMSETTNLDAFDIKILSELQKDATRSISEIGAAVNLSQNACWRRIRRLEEEKYITGRVALVDEDKVGLGVTVFASVKVAEHSEEYLAKFAQVVSLIPEVVEFYRLSGETDYLIKVLVSSIADYDRVYRKLIRTVRISDVSSSFAMEKLKHTTAVPVRFA